MGFCGEAWDYVKSLVNQLAQLYFTVCHTTTIISQELTARKVSFTRKREATKKIEKLEAELEKARTESEELVKSTSSLENFHSQVRLYRREAELKAKEPKEKLAKEKKDRAAEMAAQEATLKNFVELKWTIKELPEFDDLVKDLDTRGFDIVVTMVKKITPDLELSSAFQAFELRWRRRMRLRLRIQVHHKLTRTRLGKLLDLISVRTVWFPFK